MRPVSVSRSALRLAVSVAAMAGAAHAQTAPAQEDSVDDVIVTGRPFGVTDNASLIAVDVLDEQALAVAPVQTLGDLVAGLPGVRSSSFAPGASRPVIRGLSGPRVQVLTNGLGMIDASAVSPDHQVAVDPAEANRIETVRGPSTLTFGGSAIGGVVNILDERIPTHAAEGGVDGHVSTQYSSVDDGYGLGARLAANVGSFVLTVDGFKRDSDDYDIPGSAISQRLATQEGIARDNAGTVVNSFAEIQQVGAGASYVDDRGFVGVSIKNTQSNYGTVAEPEVSIDLEQTRYDFRAQRDLDTTWFERLNLSAGYADYEHTEFEGPEVGTIFQSSGYEGRAELIQREHDGWQGVVGVQVLDRDFDAIGEEAFVPATTIKETGLYTVQRVDLGGYGFEGGLRYDRRELAATPIGGASEVARDFDNWSASGSVFVKPAQGLFLGFSLSSSERAPSEVELFSDGVHVATAAYELGDPTLDSEKVLTLEGTVHLAHGPLEGDLHVYRARYDGFIDQRPTGADFDFDGEPFPIFAYVQTDATFTGFELEGDYALWESGERSLKLGAAADYVKADTDLGPAARIPPYSLTGRVTWTDAKWDAQLEVRHVGEQDEVAAFELPTDSYTMINLSGSIRPFADRNVTVFAEAHNITDEEAREHASFLKDIAPQPGRNLRVGVTYRF
ncbi:TonB-dependent receptor [Brevundimonas sp. NIBR11]|uniref:TonB-dependent receptor n=1 Tax=Brevundimonas sp. NIBR11 TaxID=3015999 RepID=UPI0022F073CA|nr:TonB-dependent receptor [Brevundimonas sp. NIBR11]WGM32869.1 putative TonB-dependent receptor [Brevundimonas sp. NIBR11]